MTNITPSLNDLLKSHKTRTLEDTHYSIDQLNDFLKEAYQLNARTTSLLDYLRQIRRPYLSTAPPPRHRLHQSASANTTQDVHFTDADRDSIDASTKTVLRDLHAGFTQLKSAESIRQQTEEAIVSKRRWRTGGGFLGAWAAGGSASGDERSPKEAEEEARRDTVKVHRAGILWFLERGLEEAGLVQGEMVEVRVRREVERGKSVLYKSRGGAGVGPVPVWEDAVVDTMASGVPLQELEREEQRSEGGLDEQQLQLLTRENDNMIKHYNNKLDQMKTTEKSLLEISELQSTLSINLSTQSAQIEQLISDSLSTEENIGTGNKELKRASERKSTAKFVFWGTLGFCSIMVIWDAII